ncbi:hypothetical protein A2572_03550 [Candidatus Collierbacteria bacterium RIFOXYD1_FULL_40_9]|uniref:Uncharacterized protein n=1 Tax=Candidatus Collierbacteria bacterium RIFOXYD1_FULL_40_9 TaxID=1817731 RepID=A0A1F5FUL3_9BACT|nr:MAG: hypothetical protein A2572_03550 [Candidatus Collierbacteria bacterium RIFOXYD1_FULL_40_9]
MDDVLDVNAALNEAKEKIAFGQTVFGKFEWKGQPLSAGFSDLSGRGDIWAGFSFLGPVLVTDAQANMEFTKEIEHHLRECLETDPAKKWVIVLNAEYGFWTFAEGSLVVSESTSPNPDVYLGKITLFGELWEVYIYEGDIPNSEAPFLIQ